MQGAGDMLRSGEVPCVPTVTKLPVTLYSEGSAPVAQGLDLECSLLVLVLGHTCMSSMI